MGAKAQVSLHALLGVCLITTVFQYPVPHHVGLPSFCLQAVACASSFSPVFAICKFRQHPSLHNTLLKSNLCISVSCIL